MAFQRYSVTGILLITGALCADAAIGNVQEKTMKGSNVSVRLCSPRGPLQGSRFFFKYIYSDICSILMVYYGISKAAEMIHKSYSMGSVLVLLVCVLHGEVRPALAVCAENGWLETAGR